MTIESNSIVIKHITLIMSKIPIIKKTRYSDPVQQGYLQLPDNKDFDYATVLRKDEEIYKCFKNDIWVTTFCNICKKYLCRDYGAISNHCIRIHDNSETFIKSSRKNTLKLILLSNTHLNLVENADFKSLFLLEFISRRALSNFLSIITIKVKQNIKELLANFEYVTIYFDEWSKFQHNFLGITVSTCNSIFLLDLIVPDDIERTREVISHYVKSTLENYQISNKIAFQCSDCGSNVISICENIDWFPCCNHILR